MSIFALAFTGCSVARLSRLLWEQEVASSNLATPTMKPVSPQAMRVFHFSARLRRPQRCWGFDAGKRHGACAVR